MALVKDNDITKGLSGKFESILFKTFRGKTFVYPEPKKPTRQSETQRINRDRFRMATHYAHSMMEDPAKKAYYRRIALKLNLPNAYTAAITDYMRKAKISKVTVSDKVLIEAVKKDFKIESINVVVTAADGKVLEQGAAQVQGKESWRYDPVTVKPDEMKSCKILVSATDLTGQVVEKWLDRS
jgi:hypothetical protein